MPRYARIKPNDVGTYYHLMNRIAGGPKEMPFGDVEKAKLISLLKRLCEFFTIDVMAFQVMGNHYHLVCYAPSETLSNRDVAARYNRFYDGQKPLLTPDDPYCLIISQQMRDISDMMGRLQQQFTSWYNRERIPGRRGTLWAGRFKSVILGRETALWNCLCYVEMNAFRAGLVSDPADYLFGSWGEWCRTGSHPFEHNLCRHLVEYEGDAAQSTTPNGIRRRFRVEFARMCSAESGASSDDIEDAMQAAKERTDFVLVGNRRVRHWTDGLIIGGKRFVREMASRLWDSETVRRHRLQPAKEARGAELYAYRRLNRLPR